MSARQPERNPDGTFYAGAWTISHNNGETWHPVGAECDKCRLVDDGPRAIVTAVDREAGVITIHGTTRGPWSTLPPR